MGDIFGPEDEGGALFTPAPRLTAFERLEHAIGLLKDWQGNDDITAPIERICEVVEAFDAWKVAREADPPDPDRERTSAPNMVKAIADDVAAALPDGGTLTRSQFRKAVGDAVAKHLRAPAPLTSVHGAADRMARALGVDAYTGSIEGPGAAEVVAAHRALCMALYGELHPPMTQATLLRASRGDIPAEVRTLNPPGVDADPRAEAHARIAALPEEKRGEAMRRASRSWSAPGTCMRFDGCKLHTTPRPEVEWPDGERWPTDPEARIAVDDVATPAPRGVDRQAATSKHPECSTCAMAAKGFDVWCPHMAAATDALLKGGA